MNTKLKGNAAVEVEQPWYAHIPKLAEMSCAHAVQEVNLNTVIEVNQNEKRSIPEVLRRPLS